jgi:transcriptional regulator with XRE-family HTH domain
MPAKTAPKKPFVHFIAEYRMRAGITQVQLEKLMGVGGNTIPRWERNEVRLDMPMLNAAAEALRGPLKDPFLEGKDLLHPPEERTADQMLRQLPDSDRNFIMKQIRNLLKDPS